MMGRWDREDQRDDGVRKLVIGLMIALACGLYTFHIARQPHALEHGGLPVIIFGGLALFGAWLAIQGLVAIAGDGER